MRHTDALERTGALLPDVSEPLSPAAIPATCRIFNNNQIDYPNESIFMVILIFL
jgi:hypothetical protein